MNYHDIERAIWILKDLERFSKEPHSGEELSEAVYDYLEACYVPYSLCDIFSNIARETNSLEETIERAQSFLTDFIEMEL
jgi:hypothetical protein